MLLKSTSQLEQTRVINDYPSVMEMDKQFCNNTLKKVSRSFAMVIQQLPPDLKEAIGVFYLVLRGLDTIEDDPLLSTERRHALMQEFCDHLGDPNWNVAGIGDKPEYVELMQQFHRVNHVFQSLPSGYRKVIADNCLTMAKGMDLYADKPIVTRADFDDYCYYVAGVVGEGLTGLFYSSGKEEDQSQELSVAMGLFLQKTNIIRDYREDIDSDRVFWPEEVWRKYANELADFKENGNKNESVWCVNDLVTEALNHLPKCISYMQSLKDESILRFCAIPQLMAMGTLVKLYNNPKVFDSVVKINKLVSLQIVQGASKMSSIQKWYHSFLNDLEKKLSPNDPNYSNTVKTIALCRSALNA